MNAIKRSAILATAASAIAFLPSCVVSQEANEFRFTTVSGVATSFVETAEGLSTTHADVTERKVNCNVQEMKLCINSSVLVIAIPSRSSGVGHRWTVGNTTFEEIAEIPELPVFGHTVKKVRVIRAEKQWTPSLRQRTNLYYSDEMGLVAFHRFASDGDELFLASRLPSLKEN